MTNIGNEAAISTLNGLIQTLKDGEEGFKTAADGLDDPQVKALFHDYSRQRADMARQLQSEVSSLGGDPQKAGSFSGAAHRGWINIKSVVTGKDDSSIISEAERGEDVAKKAFNDALKTALPSTTQTLVREQLAQVQLAHDRVRALELSRSK